MVVHCPHCPCRSVENSGKAHCSSRLGFIYQKTDNQTDRAVSDLVIVRTEVFEMTEDDVGEAYDDGDDQNHKGKH